MNLNRKGEHRRFDLRFNFHRSNPNPSEATRRGLGIPYGELYLERCEARNFCFSRGSSVRGAIRGAGDAWRCGAIWLSSGSHALAKASFAPTVSAAGSTFGDFYRAAQICLSTGLFSAHYILNRHLRIAIVASKQRAQRFWTHLQLCTLLDGGRGEFNLASN